jgi:hypothetical protein
MTKSGRFLAVVRLRFDAANILPGGRCQQWYELPNPPELIAPQTGTINFVQ